MLSFRLIKRGVADSIPHGFLSSFLLASRSESKLRSLEDTANCSMSASLSARGSFIFFVLFVCLFLLAEVFKMLKS